jgi:hypothetical protein
MKNEQFNETRADPLEAVLRELENAIVRYKEITSPETETDTFYRGRHAGYESGMKRAIEIVNYEIGIRQDSPNINYPGERPGSIDFNKYKGRLEDYLRIKGVDVDACPTRCFNGDGHKHGDAHPSLQISVDFYVCYSCGIRGDIYDAVELLEGIKEATARYKFIERLFGNEGNA